jgi:hypothetical protein
MDNTLTIILEVLAILVLTKQIVTIILDLHETIVDKLEDNNAAKRLIANHPEMKGVKLGKGANLLFFDTDDEFRKMILNNDDEGNSIAIEDDDRYGIVVVDEFNDDEDD